MSQAGSGAATMPVRPRKVRSSSAAAPSRRERGEGGGGAVVPAAGECDRVARLEQRQRERRRRTGAGREEERGAAVQLAQRGFGSRDRGAAEALVVEVPELALLVVG